MKRLVLAIRFALVAAIAAAGCSWTNESTNPDTVVFFTFENNTDKQVWFAYLRDREQGDPKWQIDGPLPGVTAPRMYPRSNGEDEVLWCHEFSAWLAEEVTVTEAEAIDYEDVVAQNGRLYRPTETLVEPGCEESKTTVIQLGS